MSLSSRTYLQAFLTNFGFVFLGVSSVLYLAKHCSLLNIVVLPPIEIAFLLGTISLCLTWEKIPDKYRNIFKEVVFSILLSCLTAIALNNSLISFAAPLNRYINALALGLIIVEFFIHRKDLSERISSDSSKEAELKHKNLYTILAIVIVVFGFVLRAWNLHYVQGADNFNMLSAKSFADYGTFVYQRNLQITYILGYVFRIFGASFEIARIPFILLGTLSIALVYGLTQKLFNKKVAILTAALVAISPVAIEESSFVREYAELFLWSISILYILYKTYLRFKGSPYKMLKFYPAICALLAGILLVYSKIVDTGTVKSGISLIFFISIPFGFYFVKDHFPKFQAHYSVATVVGLIIFVKIVYIPITMFSPNFVYNAFWYQIFFDPSAKTPMQWFSFSSITAALITTIFVASVIVRQRNIFILQFSFWSIIALFVFKYTNGYFHARYLYYVYPLYFILFGLSTYLLLVIFKRNAFKALSYPILGFFLLSSFIIPQNTVHGAKHDLSIWENINNERQPTSSGSRNFFLDVVSLMKSSGITNNDAVVIQGESPFYISWYLNYPLTRTYSLIGEDGAATPYEVGDKVFVVDTGHNTNEFGLALSQYKMGYLLWHSNYYPEADFNIEKVHFVYLGKSEDYKLYRWLENP